MFFQFLYTICTLSFVSLFLIYWKLIRPGKHIYNILRAQGIPCEPFVPLVGQIPRLYQYRKQNEIMKFHEELGAKYGSIFVFSLGLHPRLVVQDADLIADILGRAHAQNYHKPADLSFRLKPLIGVHNLLISNGNEHERARKMLNPGFDFQNLRSMVTIMTEQTSKTIDILLESREKTINLQKELSLLTLTIIASCAFGESFETIAHGREVVCDAFVAALDAIVYRTLLLIDQIPLFSRLPFWGKDIIDTGCEKALHFVEQIIADRKQGRTKNECQREDILDLLFKAVDSEGKHFTDEEIRQEAMVFVLAGHQSTGDLMAWVMYVLMTNPSVLQACQDEVDRVLPNRMIPTYEKLNELNICESVIWETLRLYPPIPFFVRQCIREHTITSPNQQIFIPLDATILINTYLIHREEKYWPKPQVFDYTRWMRDPVTHLKPKLAHPYCYLPFSSGPRNCIGQNFALLEAKVILAMFVQKCHLELHPKHQKIVLDVRITMRPKFGLFSKISRRQ
jgi:cytochrome P450/NADPH-cytochrome P450 reductase